MESFRQRHAGAVAGVLSGFDRLRLRGTLRFIANSHGLARYLSVVGVRFAQFKEWSENLTERLRDASLHTVRDAGREVIYLNSPNVSKEAVAMEQAAKHNIREGLVCGITCVEPCKSVRIGRTAGGDLDFIFEERRCQHVYHYSLDPQWGWMYARLQTWLPFTITIGLNGREWLARRLDGAGIGYLKRDNCFFHVEDMEEAQKFLDAQAAIRWAPRLDRIAQKVSPAHRELFRDEPLHYYWTVDQSEWATDVIFNSASELRGLYPALTRHALTGLRARDALRFLPRRAGRAGRAGPVHPKPSARFDGEIKTDFKEREEGVRVKHWVNTNSIKMYDKFGRVLRVETTIVNPREMKVYRKPEGDPDAAPRWLPLRKGVADTARRARLSQAANERYLDALAAVENPQPLAQVLEPLGRPAKDRSGKRVRALHPHTPEDALLLAAIGAGEHALHGFRNRDLRAALYARSPADEAEEKRRSAAVSRKLRMLRAHKLIRKVPGTHRYQLTDRGREVTAALAAANAANVKTLLAAA